MAASRRTFHGAAAGGADHQQQPSNHYQPERDVQSEFNTELVGELHSAAAPQFQVDNTRQQLVVTKLNQDISEIQLQAAIINTISNVRNAYWDYVFALQSVDVARRSVELAEQLVKDNQTRVEVGTMAPIDVVQAQSQAATQRQNLATAQGTRRTAELALKRLIVGGTQDPNWALISSPTDQPDFRAEPIDIEAAVRRALDARTDLAQAKKNLRGQQRHAEDTSGTRRCRRRTSRRATA